MQTQTPLIQINKLTIGFGHGAVLRNINLSLGTGETLAIVGESGSGKSLTALSLLHLLPAHADISGEILLKDAFTDTISPDAAADKIIDQDNEQEDPPLTDITFLDDATMQYIRGAQIAMIFQEPMTSLNPVKTCGQQVNEAIITHRPQSKLAAKKQVLQLFKDVQLPDPALLYDKYPHQISGGQKQRVMIAMAMSCSPRLLICDEPTTALDVIVQKEILQLIAQLQQKTQMSVLFISHDIQLVTEIADQIAVLYRGDLVEFGPTSQILERPEHPYTKALLACRPGLYDRGHRLPVVSDFLKEDGVETNPTAAAHWEEDPKKETEQITGQIIPVQPSAAVAAAPILTIQNLDIWYPTKRDFWGKTTDYFKAVKELSLSIYKGETLGLVGGSGCGKTTLGRAIMGLTPIHSGQLLYKGQDWQKAVEKGHLKAGEMQMIFQDPYSALNPRITVGSAIGEALKLQGKHSSKEVKNSVCQWLEKVGLQPEHYDRYPHQFSGGQRQRIVIARALILAPDFVICDESVSALDVSVQAQVLNLFNDLKAELGFTAIFISHDLSVVRYISDRIAVMNQGRIEELGPANEVYYHPKSSYTKTLLAAIPSPGKRLNQPF